jgi:hypothetical protein
MKNVIFIVNIKGIHPPIFFEYCLNTWSFWAKKNDAVLCILEKPLHGKEHFSAPLQKYFAFEVLRKNYVDFDQVAIIDADTMVRWDCPNFFKLSKNKFCAVIDDAMPKWVASSLHTYQHLFPEITVNSQEYFNSGVMVLNKTHSNILSGFIDFIVAKEKEISRIHSDPALRAGFDQTLFNFFIKEKKVEVVFFPKIFNFYHLIRQKLLEKKEFIDCAYIWHFNGMDHAERKKRMQETWESIKKNYPKKIN